MSRISPIMSPTSLKMRFVYWYSKRMFGRVLETLQVTYVRRPKLFSPYIKLLNSLDHSLELDKNIITLVKAHVSEINGCEFCADLAIRTSQKDIKLLKQLGSLPNYKGVDLFTPREQAVLSYVEEATENRKASEVTFTELQRYCNDNEILDITWLNAAENFLNLTAVPLEIKASEYCDIYNGLRESREIGVI